MPIKKEKNRIIFSRTFQAAIEKVYDAYTKKELFEQWFHPKGASIEVYHFNAVEGGEAFFAIQAPNMTSYSVTKHQIVAYPHQMEYLD